VVCFVFTANVTGDRGFESRHAFWTLCTYTLHTYNVVFWNIISNVVVLCATSKNIDKNIDSVFVFWQIGWKFLSWSLFTKAHCINASQTEHPTSLFRGNSWWIFTPVDDYFEPWLPDGLFSKQKKIRIWLNFGGL
jgi:hypothetical protein